MDYLKIILVISFITYVFFILLDYLGLISNSVFRIKREDNDKYKIQCRNVFMPIWHNCGMGDVTGMEFNHIMYYTYKEALKAKREYEKNGIL